MASRREGQNLGPYRLIGQIGEGGMATVYKAYQPSMERFVAVKILPPHYADDPEFAERFVREARTIAKLEHQNILPVYDFGEQQDTFYLVMRYLEGGTLKSVMNQGRLTLSDIEKVFTQICSALDYAHRQGVIHRDVKPANIMIDKEGAVYLTDFGIAKVLEGISQLTATGAAIGTPTYMAPEQSLAKSVDARSDNYALGVVLYEMVVGKVPYEADTPMAVALAHIHEPLPLPREIDPSIPESIEAVIIKAMAKEPDDRYQSANELAVALRNAVQEAATIRTETAETTLLDLVTEAWMIQQEGATQIVEELIVEEPPARLEVPPIIQKPVARKEVLEPFSTDVAAPRRRSPIRVVAFSCIGLSIVACCMLAAIYGIYGGDEDFTDVTPSGETALELTQLPSDSIDLISTPEQIFPLELNDFIKNPEVIFYDDFEEAKLESWKGSQRGIEFSADILTIDDSSSLEENAWYQTSFPFSRSNAILLQFKFNVSSMPSISYTDQNDSAKQIQLKGFERNCLYMFNNETMGGSFLWGNLHLVPDQWYYLLTIYDGIQIYEWVWEPGSTSNLLQGVLQPGAEWDTRELNIQLRSENGPTHFESFMIFENEGVRSIEAERDYIGERIDVRRQTPSTYPSNTPFHIHHGWEGYYESFEGFPKNHDHYFVQLEVDGTSISHDFIDHVIVARDNQEEWYHKWVFKFPEGLEGEHTFTIHYYMPCGRAVEKGRYEGECISPLDPVEVILATHVVDFE